ncbi:hypothetical protein ACP70R_024562 [Stipagrostis hirtigluma subsp. patula]
MAACTTFPASSYYFDCGFGSELGVKFAKSYCPEDKEPLRKDGTNNSKSKDDTNRNYKKKKRRLFQEPCISIHTWPVWLC